MVQAKSSQDSAGGSSKQARDPEYQAVLPIFGKVMNTEKNGGTVTSDKLLDLVNALGCGIDKSFNIDELKYNKIVVMSDADDDGAHIICLWATFFYNHYRELIENGYIYAAAPPLFRLVKGNSHKYIYTKDELAKYKEKDQWHVQYIKGLGEMNPDQLWESTLDPKKRHLYKITIEDAEKCAKMVSDIMGKDSEARKNLVLNNFGVE